jgi:hypothetical protein
MAKICDKRIRHDLNNTIQEAKEGVTRTPPTIGGELMCSGRASSFCSTNATRRVTLVNLITTMITLIIKHSLC